MRNSQVKPTPIQTWFACLTLLATALPAAAQFRAFNDHHTGPNTHPNATIYSVFHDPNPTGGPLKDIVTGATLPVTLTINNSGAASGNTMGAPVAGTPAANLFGPFVDYGSGTQDAIQVAAGNFVDYTFAGLNPNARYTFKGSASRANNYNDRWITCEIISADSFVAAHEIGTPNNVLTSAEAGDVTATQVVYNSGDNDDSGSVIGWSNIVAGADGTITIRCTQYQGANVPASFGGSSGGSYAYAFSALMLEEVDVTSVPVSITTHPQDRTVRELSTVTFTAKAAGNPQPSLQWYKNEAPIQDATNETYTLVDVPLSDNEAVFKLVAQNVVSNLTYAATSSVAELTVLADTNRPVLVEAYPVGLTQVLVVFSERVSADSAIDLDNYGITHSQGFLIISNAVLDVSQTNVLLSVQRMTEGIEYTLTVNGITDLASAGNVVAPNSTAQFVAVSYTPTDVGNPAIAGSAVPASSGFNITGGGTDIGGSSDQFFFSYQQRSGDFDVKVRVAGLSPTDAWAKAGLMARETLAVNSRFAGAFATPSISGNLFQYRSTAGGAAVSMGGFPVNYPRTWLRLRRAGNNFSGYASLDGQMWVELGTVSIAMPSTVYFGYAVCSRSATAATTAQFRQLGNATGEPIGQVKLTREPPGPSSRRSGLVITEIMYNPRELEGTNNSLEFVEIFNSQSYFEDLSGFRLSSDIDYTFPEGTILPSGGILVVAQNPAVVQNYYGISGVYGPFMGSLNNAEGRVRLRNKSGGVIQEVNYSSRPPWPKAADGVGHSLVLARPSYGEGDPAAWEASDVIDGSPGRLDGLPVDPMRSVAINEFLANSEAPARDFIELYNYSNVPVDLSGAWLSDKRGVMLDETVTNKFRIPDGTILGARSFIAFDESQLNFALSSDGETIILVNSNLNRVIDIVVFEGQQTNVSSGRYPDGSPGFHTLASSTPGTNNTGLLTYDIVINELMYHPISNNDDDEYVELYNKGSNTVDLSNWRFTAGINFTIPAGTMIPANGYLVVARNATNLLAPGRYPQLNAGNTVGDYTGVLANGGERVALSMPEYVLRTNEQGGFSIVVNYILVDEVTYRDGGRWGDWADGGGSSLELIDPRSDNRRAASWADSDETAKGPWTNVVHTMVADHVYPVDSSGATMDEVQVMILGRGEVLMDDVLVHPGATGANLVSNPSFNTGTGGWTITGNHVRSSSEPVNAYNPSPALRIRATAGGDNGANRVECQLNGSLGANSLATIGAKLRWLCGYPEVLLRVHGGGIEAVVALPLPSNLGTPGQRNSRMVDNAGPAIWEVSHSPILPPAASPVLVTARLHDPDAFSSVQLRYRVDPSATYINVPMNDNGLGGDEVAGDGLFTGQVPGQASGALVAFLIQATDAYPAAATTTFPVVTNPRRECLIRFGEPNLAGNLGIYRIWMTAANVSTWSSREHLSNEPQDGTFVYGNYRVIYNAGARYRGSPFTRPNGDPAAGNNRNYVWTLPDDDLFLGADELNLDSLEPGGRDATALREVTAFTMAEQLGDPFSYQRHVHVVFNGVTSVSRGVPVYTDTQQPNADYMSMWFPDDGDGEIFKVDDWFEFADSGKPDRQGNKSASLEVFNTTGGEKKKARYRWSWEKKFNRGLDDDYSTIFRAADALAATDSIYVSEVESIIDAEQWMCIFALGHVVGDWDRYGYNRGKNNFIFRPRGGRIQFLHWDLDFSLGCNGGHGPTQNLFQINTGGATASDSMPEVNRMYNHPYFRRMYLRSLQRIADGPLQVSAYSPKLDARYQGLLDNGVTTTTSPYVGSGAQSISIPAWIDQRRNYVVSQLSSLAPNQNFVVNWPANTNLTSNYIALTGNAPLSVKMLKINGIEYLTTWTTPTAWNISFYVNEPTNSITVQAFDLEGNLMTNYVQNRTLVYVNPIPPLQNTVKFNEIMFNPTVAGAEYVEIVNSSPDFTFDLSLWRVNGLGYTFPAGSFIQPRQTIVLAKDRATFTAVYGAAAASAIAGIFEGNLDKDGETLSLIKPASPNDEESVEVVVNRVRYEPGLPWPQGANGNGAALQVLDNSQDNTRVINWTDASGWQYISFTGSNTVVGLNTNLLFLPGGVGEIYIDDVWVVEGDQPGVGQNLIQNGDFEAPLEGGAWLFSTNLTNSTLSTDVKHSGNSSLRMECTRPGTSLFTSLLQPVAVSNYTVYSVSFWYMPSATIPTMQVRITSQVRINASVGNADSSLSPGRANPVAVPLPEIPPVWLNELQAENQNGLLDNAGDADPWIELYNSGTNSVSLDGWYLSDNYSDRAQWAFPAGTVIEPKQFLVVWVDGEPGETAGTNLHTSFRLPTGAGSVSLNMPVTDVLKTLDYLNYTNLPAGRSYGAYPNGQAAYRERMHLPTPGAPNSLAVPSQPLFINEWMASNTRTLVETNGSTYEDWFEIYNPGDTPVSLEGYYLTDTNTNPFQYQIPAGYFVPARGYLLVWADNEPSRNSTNSPDLHVNFRLSRQAESIILYAPNGQIIDSINFGMQESDISQGRYPDGTTALLFMTNATPRAANVSDVVSGNTPPILGNLEDQSVILGQILAYTVSATDTDTPPQTLTFSLESGALPGAAITAGGQFTWTPTANQAPSTNTITVRVTDNGSPPKSATGSFVVVVGLPPTFEAGNIQITGDAISIGFKTVPGKTYQAQYKDQIEETTWHDFGPAETATGHSLSINDNLRNQWYRFYRVIVVE